MLLAMFPYRRALVLRDDSLPPMTTPAEHADIVREILAEMGNGDRTPEEYDSALAALDALQAQAEQSEYLMLVGIRDKEAAEAGRDRLRDALRKIARQADHIDKARHIARVALAGKDT